jgi:hypothetical protein
VCKPSEVEQLWQQVLSQSKLCCWALEGISSNNNYHNIAVGHYDEAARRRNRAAAFGANAKVIWNTKHVYIQKLRV